MPAFGLPAGLWRRQTAASSLPRVCLPAGWCAASWRQRRACVPTPLFLHLQAFMMPGSIFINVLAGSMYPLTGKPQRAARAGYC